LDDFHLAFLKKQDEIWKILKPGDGRLSHGLALSGL
jgi:hypothetical protein